MKITIGVLNSLDINQNIENIASEFYGELDETMSQDEGILWLKFNSKINAHEFAQIINLRCVDKDEKAFK